MQELQKRRKVQVPSDIFRNLSLKQAFYLAIPGDVSLDQQEEIEIVDVPPEFQDSLIAIILKVTRFKTLEEMLANLGNKIAYFMPCHTKEKILEYYAHLNPDYLARIEQNGITLYTLHVTGEEC